jgi:hypothetical protein
MKLTRKELASLISELRDDKVTTDQIRKNEKSWGLTESRGRDINSRVIRYDKAKALRGLKKAGIIEDEVVREQPVPAAITA